MTNMGGRLESHLREVKLEELFQELKRKMGEKKAIEKLERLSEANGTKDKVSPAKTYEEKVLAATRYAHGQKTLDDAIGQPWRRWFLRNHSRTGRRRSVALEQSSPGGCGGFSSVRRTGTGGLPT